MTSADCSIVQVLETISDIIQRFESDEVQTPEKLKEWQRILSCNLFYLAEFKKDFKEQWNQAKYNSPGKSIAAKEFDADMAVPELYMARTIYDAGTSVLITMGSNLRNES